jgi:jasmonic acid-amino synthetase
VKIAGFHNATPELQFICRRSLVLSVNIDKNTEKDLQLAVEAAEKLLAAEKLEVVDFTSLVDRSSEPGHYVVFWELSSDDGASEDVLSGCASCMDLAFADAGYVGSSEPVQQQGAADTEPERHPELLQHCVWALIDDATALRTKYW